MAYNPPTSTFHIFFLFSLLLFYSLMKTYGRPETLANHHHHHHIIEVKSLFRATTCSEFPTRGIYTDSFSIDYRLRARNKGSMLPMFDKDGPCSPLSTGDKTEKARNYTHVLIQDQARVQSIHSRISKEGISVEPEAVRLPANSGKVFGTGNYYVTVGIGTPKRDLPLVFDTGSDLTWIQCQPCLGGCYPQTDPKFEPLNSSSYSNITCNSTECIQLESGTGNAPRCRASTCVYSITYGDNSYSQGFFAHETLAISPSDVFPNFQFGCGQSNGGLFKGTAGLLGLGQDKISFVSQTSQKYKKLFSYCISPSSSGFLAFGDSSSVTQFTPLLKDKRGPSFYFLNLEGISVGGQELAISPSTFSLSGTIIDSGTVVTRLAPSAYAALRDAFQQAMKSYPRASEFSLLDTCYDLSGNDTVTVPTIVLHFQGGTDLDVNQYGILLGPRQSQLCLAFIGNSNARDVAIIGNLQQKTVEVVYDVAGGKLGFGPGGCN
ncbi:hypothetical protein IFM89_019691 [Coptis chinensis]|uniref:Peptidase A1 domain-containing protein n=1 Tax=Coptis chinensis TaxID=261450 RepID=A0A835LMT6_9MAGN|nr:hypothetical protein IFM89_019691 [Coptis chinensis]